MPDAAPAPGRRGNGIIPIRGAANSPVALVHDSRLRRPIPVARRPWRVLVVSATAGSPTRTFDLARWQARAIAVTVAVLLLIAGTAVGTVVVALFAPDLFVSGETAQLRGELLAARDSLALARLALADGDSASADSTVAAAEAADEVAPGPAASAHRPLVAPMARGGRALGLRATTSLEGLPVIGMIASTFSLARRHPLLRIVRPHLGVDLAAPSGTRITAPARGRVTFAGRKFALGMVVEIDHGGGVTTRYAHCRSIQVQAGQIVAFGAQIATVGSTGLSTGPHLHYEVLINGRQVDPLRFRMPQSSDLTPAGSAAPLGSGDGAPASLAPESGRGEEPGDFVPGAVSPAR